MKNSYSGEYHQHWRTIAEAYKAAARDRCVRCHHPFEPLTGRVRLCDSQCDATRGAHRNADPRLSPFIRADDDPRIPGLNYGVHHFDGDKSNNRWWNLMPLCNSCHLKIQSSVVPERHWLFEHSDWIKPYVAGFYAYWFAKELPTREWVDENLDHYLAIGQPWLYAEKAAVSA